MAENSSVNIETLQKLAEYFHRNKANIKSIYEDFGEFSFDNGHGTIFLKPKNSLFKVLYVHQENSVISTVGIGGENLGLTLEELYNFYNKYAKTYSHYDDGYNYVFYSPNNINYALMIFSKEKILYGKSILKNIDINRFDISLK